MSAQLHSELGASKAERWINCPGSVNAERGLFSPPSDYAVEGTAAHALAEKCLTKGVDPYVYLDTSITVEVEIAQDVFEKRQIEVTDEMCEAITTYVDYVREHTSDERMIEVRFNLAPLNPPEPMFGTADAADYIERERHLKVIDLKYGSGVAVDAEKNVQLMFYALGVVVEKRKRPSKITVTIVQPRAQHPEGIIRSYTFDWAELLEYKKMLFEAAVATQTADAPRNVGDHCRFCKAAARCPAQRNLAVEIAQSEFDIEPEFAVPNLPAADALSDEQLNKVLRAASYVEEWFKACRLYVSNELNAGREFAGWKLVPKRAMRKWKDEDKTKRVLLMAQGIDADDVVNTKFKSPAQVEAMLKQKQVSLDIEYLVEKISSGSNLAPADDPRPALMPQAQEDFDVEAPEPSKPTKRAKRKGAQT
jgi:hypothetical protein